MLDIIKSIIFGIVEGITEWLPISSTGHLILIEEFLKFENVSAGFWDMFLTVVQLGAILAVVVLFWNKIFPFKFKEKPIVQKDIFIMWFKIAVACIPGFVVMLLGIDDKCDELFYNGICVAIALIVFGIAFIVVETINKNKTAKVTSIDQISFLFALYIGLFQLLAAFFPGTSRSGATIIGALLIGISRTAAAEFTFILAIPTMLGASMLKLLKFGFDFTGNEIAILAVGTIVAFVVSIFVIHFLLDYIRKHDFKVFGWYRIVLGAIVLIYFALK